MHHAWDNYAHDIVTTQLKLNSALIYIHPFLQPSDGWLQREKKINDSSLSLSLTLTHSSHRSEYNKNNSCDISDLLRPRQATGFRDIQTVMEKYVKATDFSKLGQETNSILA